MLDLAGPAQAFDTARKAGASYLLRYCSSQPTQVSAQGMVLTQLAPLAPVAANDLIIVPGIEWGNAPLEEGFLDQETRDWLYSAFQTGASIASVCTGAFALGEAKLLDGRRCTTHWAQVDVLQARFPRASVLDNVLFVHDGMITTSAGIASGIDMALEFLEQDQGPMFAAQIARYLVVYMRRNGSQPQRSIYLAYRTHLHSGVHRVQDFLIDHVAEHVSLSELADIAGVSTRGLSRAFKESTGLTPVQYHQRLRLELAATLLSNPTLRVEEIALKCGFEDVRHFRRLWQREYGQSPSASRALYHIS
jgi:transcriptional regulator GlxA family with amidase domain